MTRRAAPVHETRIASNSSNSIGGEPLNLGLLPLFAVQLASWDANAPALLVCAYVWKRVCFESVRWFGGCSSCLLYYLADIAFVAPFVFLYLRAFCVNALIDILVQLYLSFNLFLYVGLMFIYLKCNFFYSNMGMTFWSFHTNTFKVINKVIIASSSSFYVWLIDQ